ncbi:disintegrin and metalloproteinase domain-containing protein 12 isoform X4 [Carassius gibelio]|uniref:disintegrin and metalloproteinase domain-containing protein 12 isoform X4 n=1 Tax=Carassius gibelio TaxID=101364 RepID=UPI00227790AA|nr:disintegrin and metalloproteinase domain-containing protein 12 isoform X4 [Carassius gibelio]
MKHHHQLFRCFWRTLFTVLLFEGTPLLMFRGSLTLTLNRDDSSFTRITNSSHNVTSHRRELKPLAKTRPFAVVDGVRRSLSDVLQNGHPDRLQCGLQVGSSMYILDLEKNKALLPKPPNVFYYLPNGTGVSMKENPVMHCYYHGSVQGFPQSRVALSSCSGLRGVIVINATLSFELRPEEEKHDREEEGSGEMEEGWMHGIYPTDSQTSKSRDCGVSHTSIPPIQIIPHTHRSKRDILSETKYIELVLVVDHKEYLNYQKNNKTIIYRMLDVANQVDWFYRPLNVRVALVGLEIWSDQDKIKVDKNPTETLNRFLDWRTGDLLPRLRHDNAQLIMGESFDGTTVGMASQSSMCSKDRSGGVNVDHLVSVLGVASTVAHELGHNLGMSHDTADRRCQCQNEPRLGGCIMEPSTGFMPGQLFSSCSERDLSLSLLHGGGMCLFNVPQPESLQGGPRCGNLYVERGEECDCGLLENGESCKDGSSYCYSGACASLDEQCQMLWGQNSTHAPPICFSSVNKQGNKYGNCGQMSNGSYIPCLKGDVHCGRIQCQGGNERPLLGSNAEILTTTVKLNQSDFTCRGAYFNLGDDVSDPAMVSQGTACGPNKACVDQQCRDVAMFGVEECRRKCNGHGVCNSNKNCHCDEGWAPPDCRYSGTGGSVDSGPAREPEDSDPAQVALLVIFLFVLPVSLLFVALRFPRCRRGLVYLGHTPFNKSRQSRGVSVAYIEYCVKEENQRTPAVELANARNGDQVQPLRYQWPHQSDIPLTQAISKVQNRPAAPTKPLPPDPVIKPAQLAGHWPAPPAKPLPPDPIPSESKMQCKPTGARSAAPSKPLPPDPVISTRQNPAPPKPPVPKKPLPVDPSSHAPPPPLLGHPGPAASSSSYSCNPASAAAPARPAPHPPLRRQQYPRIPHTLHQI